MNTREKRFTFSIRILKQAISQLSKMKREKNKVPKVVKEIYKDRITNIKRAIARLDRDNK